MSQSLFVKKLMTSKRISISCEEVVLRSLLMFGPSKGFIKGNSVKIDSVSGQSEIEGNTVDIDRYYGGDQTISVLCREVGKKIGIETGTGSIRFYEEEGA